MFFRTKFARTPDTPAVDTALRTIQFLKNVVKHSIWKMQKRKKLVYVNGLDYVSDSDK